MNMSVSGKKALDDWFNGWRLSSVVVLAEREDKWLCHDTVMTRGKRQSEPDVAQCLHDSDLRLAGPAQDEVAGRVCVIF